MNARLRIIVQVISADAAKLRQMQAAMAGLGASAAKAGFGVGRLASSFSKFTQIGKNLQWTGRQLEFRFTLPLLLAGAAATKFALDNERAITQVRKVYGDLSMTHKQVDRDMKLLAKGFRALSDTFGVQQKEVIGIGAAWAQAGAQGAQLAKATKLTLEAMILGQIESKDAAMNLITVMLAYRLTTKELRLELANLNAIENQTAVSFGDLIAAVQKAGGVARNTGIDIRHLGAMIAAISPAAATGMEAGTGLKVIMQRLFKPTQQAVEVLSALGINVEDASWRSKNGTERFLLLGDALEKLTHADKMRALSTLFEFRRANQALTLIDDMRRSTDANTRSTSQYARALDATADKTQVLALYTRELGIFLGSNPQKFQILITQLQNMLAQVIAPLLPSLLGLIAKVRDLIRWFTGLDPAVQQLVLGFLLFIAIFGPIIAYTGAFITLLGALGSGLIGALGPLAAFTGSWVLVAASIVGVIALIWVFHDDVAVALADVGRFFEDLGKEFTRIPEHVATAFSAVFGVIDTAMSSVSSTIFRSLGQLGAGIAKVAFNIAKAVSDSLWSLPKSIVGAFRSVINIVKRAVLIVYEWLSYLNPFATHSPSLVESVARGVDFIARKYASLRGVGSSFRAATADFKAFITATSGAQAQIKGKERDHQRFHVRGQFGGQLAAWDRMSAAIDRLYVDLRKIGAEFDKQAAVVARWEARLKEAENGLNGLDNKLFKNEQDANKLRLAILQWEDANGTIDDLNDRIGDLQGELEGLRGQRVELIGAGAGSDVLAPIDAEIARLEGLQHALVVGGGSEIDNLRKQLDELERHGEIMRLQRDIALDPIQRTLDMEKAKLDELATAYDGIENQIRDMETALNDFASEAEKLSQEIWDAAIAANQAMADAAGGEEDPFGGAGGDFEIPGGTGPGLGKKLKGEGGNLQKTIDKMMKDAQKTLGKVDLLGPFKKEWHKLEDWLGNVALPWIKTFFRDLREVTDYILYGWAVDLAEQFWNGLSSLPGKIVALFEGIGQMLEPVWHAIWDPIVTVAESVWATLTTLIDTVFTGIVAIFEATWNTIVFIFESAWETIKTVVETVAMIVAGIIESFITVVTTVWNTGWEWIKQFVTGIWTIIKTVIETAILVIKTIITTVFNTIKTVIETVWNSIKSVTSTIWEGIRTVIDKALGGIHTAISFAVGLFGKAWEGLKSIFAAPINWVVENVINGFIGAVNKVGELLGIGKLLDPVTWRVGGGGGRGFLGFHEGGVIGADQNFLNRPNGLRPNEQLAVLEQGEGVIPASAMQRMGTDLFDRIRRGAFPKFHDGGIVGANTKGTSDWARAWDGFGKGSIIDDIAGEFIGLVRKGIAEVARPAINAGLGLLEGLVGRFGGFAKIPIGGARKIGNAALDWIAGVDSGAEAKERERNERLAEARAARGSAHGLDRELVKRFDEWNAFGPAHGTMQIISGFRNRAQQQAAWDRYQRGQGPLAARPGTSKHERGLAIDHTGPNGAPSTWGYAATSRPFGLHHPVPGEPWHVEMFDRGGWLRPGWTAAFNGTRQSEMVLPPGERSGKKEYHFYGDLSFPNVRDGNDAEEFIRNLEATVDS